MTPTFDAPDYFRREYSKLSREMRAAFGDARRKLVEGLATSGPEGLSPSLRVKRVQGSPDVWEMTFAPDGRATFSYGEEVKPGEPHVVWRRIGGHEIFKRP